MSKNKKAPRAVEARMFVCGRGHVTLVTQEALLYPGGVDLTDELSAEPGNCSLCEMIHVAGGKAALARPPKAAGWGTWFAEPLLKRLNGAERRKGKHETTIPCGA